MNTVHSSRFTVHSRQRRAIIASGRSNWSPKVGSRAGFTIVELMIAITITVLAMAGVYTSFIVQQRSFTAQDQVAETQVSSKIAFDLTINDIRHVGFGYPGDEAPSINGFTDVITYSDNTGPNNADQITLVGGFRQVATLAAPAVVGQNTITITYLLGATSLNLSNRKNISIEGIDFAIISNCTDLGSGCEETSPLTLDRGVSKPFPAGRPVYLVEDITYQTVTATGANCGNAPAGTTCLEKSVTGGGAGNVDTVANYIDDLQLAYAVDTNSDDQIDDQNGNSVFDPGDYLTPALPPNSKILAVRVSLLASTANEDPTLAPSTKPYYSSGIVLENNTTVDTDRLRRRIWSMEIALRNTE